MEVSGPPASDELLAAARAREGSFAAALADLVAIDSGTDSPDGVDRMADHFGELLAADAWRVERRVTGSVSGRRWGDLLIARRTGSGTGRVLMLGHLDTVFPDGTAADRPFAVLDGRAYGPGVCDMKGGLLVGLHSVAALNDTVSDGFAEVVFICNPDEERGSPTSREVILEEARRSDAVLVLEAARENGDVVSSRKGVTTVRIEILGRAAHAGVEPERGRSAVVEAAWKIEALHSLHDGPDGTTVNVGVVHAGTRSNVVPERAVLDIDVRASSEAALSAVESAVERIAMTNTVDGVTSAIDLVREVRPMERSAGTVRLFRIAQSIAQDLGFPLAEAATGGASDANATSAIGVPTLDGLGPVGGDDHSEREWIDMASVAPRTALLAGLIAAIGRGAP